MDSEVYYYRCVLQQNLVAQFLVLVGGGKGITWVDLELYSLT